MTSSILTNMSAMSAVANLAATQKNLAMVQNEISTGLSVASASDNAAYYSISTSMNTQNADLGAVTSSLNLGASVLSTATSALSSMTSILTKISTELTNAFQSGTPTDSIGTDIKALQSQLQSTIQSAAFNGVNLLDGSATNAKFVSSVTGTGSSTQVNFLSVDTTASNLGNGTASKFAVAAASSGANAAATVDIYAFSSTDANALSVSSTTTSDTLAQYISAVGSALTNLNNASESLGASQKNVDLQSTFISSLSNSITAGVGSLVDADMNAASTRLSALQTQQQLGVQALSVANQNSQLILKLFQ